MDKQIENCPCCRGKAKIKTPVDFFVVECSICELSTKLFHHEHEAITAWNTRTTPTPPAGQVEAVAEDNDIVLFIEKLQCLPINMTSRANQDYIEMGEAIYHVARQQFKASGAEQHIAGLVSALEGIEEIAGRIHAAELEGATHAIEVQDEVLIHKAAMALKALPPEIRGK